MYVASGFDNEHAAMKDCEKYDAPGDDWRYCNHELPFGLAGAVSSVSKDESFAIVVGGITQNKDNVWAYNNSIIIFTEREGFSLLDDISRKMDRISTDSWKFLL